MRTVIRHPGEFCALTIRLPACPLARTPVWRARCSRQHNLLLCAISGALAGCPLMDRRDRSHWALQVH